MHKPGTHCRNTFRKIQIVVHSFQKIYHIPWFSDALQQKSNQLTSGHAEVGTRDALCTLYHELWSQGSKLPHDFLPDTYPIPLYSYCIISLMGSPTGMLCPRRFFQQMFTQLLSLAPSTYWIGQISLMFISSGRSFLQYDELREAIL